MFKKFCCEALANRNRAGVVTEDEAPVIFRGRVINQIEMVSRHWADNSGGFLPFQRNHRLVAPTVPLCGHREFACLGSPKHLTILTRGSADTSVKPNFGDEVNSQRMKSAKDRSKAGIIDPAGFQFRYPLLVGTYTLCQLSLGQTAGPSHLPHDQTDISHGLQPHERAFSAQMLLRPEPRRAKSGAWHDLFAVTVAPSFDEDRRGDIDGIPGRDLNDKRQQPLAGRRGRHPDAPGIMGHALGRFADRSKSPARIG